MNPARRPISSAICAPRCRQPTDDGKTYTFKIRDGVKFHNGDPLTAEDVAASWNRDRLSAGGRAEPARSSNFIDGRQDRGARPDNRRLPPEIRHRARSCRRWPTRTPSSTRRRSSTRTRTGTKRTSWAPARSSLSDYEIGQSIKGERNPDYYHKGLPYLDGFVGIYAPKQATRVDAIRSRPRRDRVPRLCRPPRATS